jgi:hypothetical protein
VHSANIQHTACALEDAIAFYAVMSCHLILNAFCQKKHGGNFYALQARDCVLCGFTEILPD